MKITNADLVNAIEPFAELMKVKMPAKVSYEIIRLAKSMDEYLQPALTVKGQLIVQYGHENPKTLQPEVTPDDEGFAAFYEEYGELLVIEHEIEIAKVVLPEDIEVSPVTLLALEKFVTV